MTIEAFNTAATREVQLNFTTKRRRSLPNTDRFWLIRNTIIERADYVVLDILGLREEPELAILIPQIMHLLDSGIPPLPQDVIASQLWPSSAPILDHVAYFSTFPDSRPCPSPQFWRNLRGA